MHTVASILQHNLLVFSPLCGATKAREQPTCNQRAASHIILMRTWKPSATQTKVAAA